GGLLVVFEGGLVPALPVMDGAEIGQGAGFAVAVTGPLVPGTGLLVVVGRLVVPAQAEVGGAQAAQRLGLADCVAGALSGPAGVAVDRERVGGVAAGEGTVEGGGQLDGVRRPAALGGGGGPRDPGGAVGVGPRGGGRRDG